MRHARDVHRHCSLEPTGLTVKREEYLCSMPLAYFLHLSGGATRALLKSESVFAGVSLHFVKTNSISLHIGRFRANRDVRPICFAVPPQSRWRLPNG